MTTETIKVIPQPGRKVRREDGAVLAEEGELVEPSAYWLRRQNDGDVTIESAAPPAPAEERKKDA